jgi:hypothetical protein
MNLAEAQTELATIITAIGEYVQGKRRKRIKIMSAGVQREHEFSDSETLFKYLTTRRAELEAFIAGQLATTTDDLASAFIQNRNIPMVFKR